MRASYALGMLRDAQTCARRGDMEAAHLIAQTACSMLSLHVMQLRYALGSSPSSSRYSLK